MRGGTDTGYPEQPQEILDRMDVYYLMLDGTHAWPNSREGQLLRMTHRWLTGNEKPDRNESGSGATGSIIPHTDGLDSVLNGYFFEHTDYYEDGSSTTHWAVDTEDLPALREKLETLMDTEYWKGYSAGLRESNRNIVRQFKSGGKK